RRGGTGFPRDSSPPVAYRDTQAPDARGGRVDRGLLQQGEEAGTGPSDLYGAEVRFEAPPRQTRSGDLYARTRASGPPQIASRRFRPKRYGWRTRGVELRCRAVRKGGTRPGSLCATDEQYGA